MELFNMFFHKRFKKIYSSIANFALIALLFSSCSTSKSTSYAYLDDIYYDTFRMPTEDYVDEYLEEDNGVPPSNVPGAAYVYQPIPEPNIDAPGYSDYSYISDRNNVLYGSGDDYYYSPYNPYSPYALGNSLSPYGNSFFSYGIGFTSYFGGSSYYSGYPGGSYYCPSNEGSSSTSFITKRFSWDDSANENIQYLNKIANNNSNSSISTSNTNTRSSKSRKGRFVNSSSDSGNSGIQSLFKSSDSRSGSASPSRSNSSSGSRSGSRSSGSSGSSKSYSGKRIR